MKVWIEPISRGNFDDVIELELEAHQVENLPSNVYSIAESSLSASFHPRAVFMDGKVVGFVMYEFGELDAVDEDECTIWRFMIDWRFQGKGIGTTVMGQLIEEIISHNRCNIIDIYYGANNVAAERLYCSFGFKAVGHRDDGDIIAELEL